MSKTVHPLSVARSPRVLLILDMISDFEFPDGKGALRAARRIAPCIARLKKRAVAAHIPVIYVNDNLGRWRSDIQAIVRRCRAGQAVGRDVVEQIAPEESDFVVLKPKHSGFYATPLAALLEQAGARELILTGLSAHQCILFTANDAYLRDFKLIIPSDCIGAPHTAETGFALRYFESVLGARTTESGRLRLR